MANVYFFIETTKILLQELVVWEIPQILLSVGDEFVF